MRAWHRATRRMPAPRGLSLIEVLAIIVVLGVTVPPSMIALDRASEQNARAVRQTQAVALLELIGDKVLMDYAQRGSDWVLAPGYQGVMLEELKSNMTDEYLMIGQLQLTVNRAFNVDGDYVGTTLHPALAPFVVVRIRLEVPGASTISTSLVLAKD